MALGRAIDLIIGAALVAVTVGCDGAWQASGRVVAMRCGEAQTSRIVETTVLSSEAPMVIGMPVTSGQVQMFHQLHGDGSPKRDTIWIETEAVKGDGSFYVEAVGSPHQKEVGLEVTAPGFQTAYIKYRLDDDVRYPESQTFLVVLVPEGCPR